MQCYIQRIESPWGFWMLHCSDESVMKISFSKNPPVLDDNPNALTEFCSEQFKAYFDARLKNFDLPLDMEPYSDFFKQVWSEVSRIPYGKTASYTDIALKLGDPDLVRAVGMANAKNVFPLVIPCHRIIGKDKSLTGYAFGLDLKKKLLFHEGALSLQASLF